MRITTKTDYAVIILTALAHRSKEPVALERISATAGVSEAYLQRIAANLKKHRLIRSKRGAFGGYLLHRPPSRITLAMIVNAVGDNLHCVRCTQKKNELCPHIDHCQTKSGWTDFQRKISRLFDQETLASMIAHDD